MRCGHVTCNRKIQWEHSPTRNKSVEMARLNRGSANTIQLALPPPLSNQGPLYSWALHLPAYLPRGAPHGCPRGRADTRGLLPRVRTLCASCASSGLPVALPRGLSATSHPRGGPACHVSAPAGPARHVTLQVSKIPFFVILIRKNT